MSNPPRSVPAGQLRRATTAETFSNSPEEELIRSAYGGDIKGMQEALKRGAKIDFVHPHTGLSVLHIAVGHNDLAMTKFVVEECKAAFSHDRFGRWPTLIAAECEVDDALLDYVVEQEALYLHQRAIRN